MGALVKCSSLDEIGTIVFHVTVLCTTTYEKHATNSVRVPLPFFISFRLSKKNPRDFFTDQ